jgi:hypothetical protein
MDGACYRLIAGAGLEPILAPHIFGGSKASGFIQAMMAENKAKHTGQYRNPSAPPHDKSVMNTFVPFDYKKLANEDQDGENNARYGASPFIQKHFKGGPVPFITREQRLRQGDINAEVPGETDEQREARLRAQAQRFLEKAEELAGIQRGKQKAATKIQKVFRKRLEKKASGRPTFFGGFITYEKMKPFIELFHKGEGKFEGGFAGPRYYQIKDRGECREYINEGRVFKATDKKYDSGLDTRTITERGYKREIHLDVKDNDFSVKEASTDGLKELPSSVIVEATLPNLKKGEGGWYYEGDYQRSIPITLGLKFKSPEGPRVKEFSKSTGYKESDYEGPAEWGSLGMASRGRMGYVKPFLRQKYEKAKQEYLKNPEYTDPEPGLNPKFHEGKEVILTLKAMMDMWRKYYIGKCAADIYEPKRIHAEKRKKDIEYNKDKEGWRKIRLVPYEAPKLDDILENAAEIYRNLAAEKSMPKVSVKMNGAEYVYGTINSSAAAPKKWEWYDKERKKLDAEEKDLPIWGDEKSRKKREEINEQRKALAEKSKTWAE